jgi:antitoxin (DNA-binding transcriptional repressor) of toxin-antitoxin stability system
MREFTYSEARQHLASLLERARSEGGVRIRRRDGQVFVLTPEQRTGSPLDVPGLDLAISLEDIVRAVHEGRRPLERPLANEPMQHTVGGPR